MDAVQNLSQSPGNDDYPHNRTEFEERFPHEGACLEYLARLRWPGGFVCPSCESTQGWVRTTGCVVCAKCRKETSIRAGTIFERTHYSLRTWFSAAWYITNQKRGVSAVDLQHTLGLKSLDTAWVWLHKLRRAMVRPGRDMLNGTVEVDETYVGGKEPGAKGRGTTKKSLVVIAVETGDTGWGRVRLARIPSAAGVHLIGFIKGAIAPGSEVYTDDWKGYNDLEAAGYTHHIINISKSGSKAHELLPAVHRIASLLKRWMLGTHQGAIRHKYLSYYLDEFTFRFNRRSSRDRGMLFYRLLQQAVLTDPVPRKKIASKQQKHIVSTLQHKLPIDKATIIVHKFKQVDAFPAQSGLAEDKLAEGIIVRLSVDRRKSRQIQEPRQLHALFNTFPVLDPARLRQCVNNLEAGQPLCTASVFQVSQRAGNRQVATGLITFPDCQVVVIVHGWPVPKNTAKSTIEASCWPNEVKATLSRHAAYALCTVVGEAKPIDKLIALYKICVGLIDQGAVGIANDQTWSCYPSPVLDLLKEHGAWASLRREGIPAELVVNFIKAEVDGQPWFFSKGHSMFGLPELAYEAQSESEAGELRGIFNNVFYYLFERGPVVHRGDTMEIEGGFSLKYSAPSVKQRCLNNRRRTLIVTIDR